MRYRVNEPSVIHQEIDGELVIIHLDNGVYYSLNPVGARMWALLAAGESQGSVVEALSTETSADQTSVQEAVDELVEQLVGEQLLVVDGAAPGAARQLVPPVTAQAGPSDARSMPFAAPVLQRYDDLQELLLLDPIHAVDESGWPDRHEPG